LNTYTHHVSLPGAGRTWRKKNVDLLGLPVEPGDGVEDEVWAEKGGEEVLALPLGEAPPHYPIWRDEMVGDE
jgi:hypothetical protein